MAQWLGILASTAGGPSSIPGWGIKSLQATLQGLKKKKRKYRGKSIKYIKRNKKQTKLTQIQLEVQKTRKKQWDRNII